MNYSIPKQQQQQQHQYRRLRMTDLPPIPASLFHIRPDLFSAATETTRVETDIMETETETRSKRKITTARSFADGPSPTPSVTTDADPTPFSNFSSSWPPRQSESLACLISDALDIVETTHAALTSSLSSQQLLPILDDNYSRGSGSDLGDLQLCQRTRTTTEITRNRTVEFEVRNPFLQERQ